MTARQTAQRFRQRKLSVKQNLQIVREHEIEANILDDEAQRNIPKVDTGVEKAEEIEHHLQAVISAAQAGAAAQHLYIPTPETNVSTVQYDNYYAPRFQQPQTYIRFSSTVEDTSGCPYCMDTEDEVFLQKLNSRQKKAAQCTEDQFEVVMNFFEETSAMKQPFASVDNAPVLTLEEMVAAFDDEVDAATRHFCKDIYPHWKERRLSSLNHPLMPSLKFERNVDTDDSDPYVCFRRREVRQVRKTRGRDAQIVEKLKKLRVELESARHLMHLVKQREVAQQNKISLDRMIFDKRLALKMSKRQLGIKGDDEDLINQKPIPKPRPRLDPAIISRGTMGAGGMIPKVPMSARSDGRFPESDLVQLSEERARKQAEIDDLIQDSMKKHTTWNKEWVDHTWRPITPPLENANRGRNTFRDATTKFLPTPPESISEGGDDLNMIDGGRTPSSYEESLKTKLPIRFESPPVETESSHGMTLRRPSYRRRQGRGGRLFIDRRGLKRPHVEVEEELRLMLKRQRADEEEYPSSLLSPPYSAKEERERDRAAFDIDSDEDTDVYRTDPYDDWNIRYRIAFNYSNSNRSAPAPDQVAHQTKQLQEEQKRAQQAAAHGGGSSARTALMANGSSSST